MYSVNVERIAIGVVFAICALLVGATTNEANAKKLKGDTQGYHCYDQYQCNDWRGGVYHREGDGVNYYYGGGEELGYGNRPTKIHYKLQYDFQYDDGYEAPNYYPTATTSNMDMYVNTDIFTSKIRRRPTTETLTGKRLRRTQQWQSQESEHSRQPWLDKRY